jgi:hypothetical protein
MISLQKTFYPICYTGLVLLAGCQRDIPIPLPEERYMSNITFKLSGFESEITPLSGRYAKNALKLDNMRAEGRPLIVPSPEPQYLYYWSFNDETLSPDIALAEGAEITFQASAVEPDFFAGFSGDGYEAGQSMSLRGAKSLVISIPIKGAESIGQFAFDISSSDTGPKDFSLAYSIDGGMNYNMLSAANQFTNRSAQSRNVYEIDLSTYAEFIGIDVLMIKFEMSAGERPLNSAGEEIGYNQNSGTVRFDNVRFSGIYNAEETEGGDPSMPGILRYYVFSSDHGGIVVQNELAMHELGDDGLLHIKLFPGTYDVLLLAYRSESNLLLPENLTHASEFYLGQSFDDYQAVTFASWKQGLEVGNADVTEPAVLTRCFSSVTFDFTDSWSNLTKVKRIDIVRKHENFWYTPYGEPAEQPTGGLNSLSFDGLEGEEDYQLTFHQFLGIPNDLIKVSYVVTAYGREGDELNKVVLSEDIRNNMQLKFRGRLLGNIDRFSININPVWDEVIEHDFR